MRLLRHARSVLGETAVEIAGKRYHDDDACAGTIRRRLAARGHLMHSRIPTAPSRARGDDAPIATKFARAKKDPIGTLIAACCAAGLRFRWSGAMLEVDGLERLSDRDRALFQPHEDAILERLREPGGDGAALLDQLEVWTEVVRTREDAARVDRRAAGSPAAWTARPRRGRSTGLSGHGSRSPRRASAPSTSRSPRTRAGSIRTRRGCA